MNSNKTGFEIRADLLNQAQGILEQNYERQKESIYSHNESFPNDKKSLSVMEITAADVIVTARELNAFVTEK